PLSALCGPRDIMRRIEQDVFVSSTFGGEAVSLAAARATIHVLERDHVPAKLAARGTELCAEYARLAADHGVDTSLYGYPQRPFMRWGDMAQRQTFLAALADAGVLCQGYFNLTLAHCVE